MKTATLSYKLSAKAWGTWSTGPCFGVRSEAESYAEDLLKRGLISESEIIPSNDAVTATFVNGHIINRIGT